MKEMTLTMYESENGVIFSTKEECEAYEAAEASREAKWKQLLERLSVHHEGHWTKTAKEELKNKGWHLIAEEKSWPKFTWLNGENCLLMEKSYGHIIPAIALDNGTIFRGPKTDFIAWHPYNREQDGYPYPVFPETKQIIQIA